MTVYTYVKIKFWYTAYTCQQIFRFDYDIESLSFIWNIVISGEEKNVKTWPYSHSGLSVFECVVLCLFIFFPLFLLWVHVDCRCVIVIVVTFDYCSEKVYQLLDICITVYSNAFFIEKCTSHDRVGRVVSIISKEISVHIGSVYCRSLYYYFFLSPSFRSFCPKNDRAYGWGFKWLIVERFDAWWFDCCHSDGQKWLCFFFLSFCYCVVHTWARRIWS